VHGRRLGVDVGKVRVGLAVSDPDGILATPLATLARDEAGWSAFTQAQTVRAQEQTVRSAPDAAAAPPRPPADIARISELVTEHEIVEVVVGLPVTLAGTESYSAIYARQYAQVIAAVVGPVPVVLTDERMSTAVASRRLSERGVRGGRRRAVVDQAAAVEILQGWLDAGRR
jgi:putative Holliday junction resolvase